MSDRRVDGEIAEVVFRCVFVCGPTAAGKSERAIQLAAEVGGEVVNADAFQLYHGIETLTAAPTAEQQAMVPHHLFSVLDPTEENDAFRYRAMVLPILKKTVADGNTPVVVGGSGLYLKFLTHGPSPLPAADPALRRDFDQRPLEDLVAELESLDPLEAARIDTRNRRYVTRALEICVHTGEPVSELRDRWKEKEREINPRLRGELVTRPRAELHRRIEERTSEMMNEGAIAEVAAIKSPSANVRRAIGFSEIQDLSAGKIDREVCKQRIVVATRQYAKRQETWFRRETWLR